MALAANMDLYGRMQSVRNGGHTLVIYINPSKTSEFHYSVPTQISVS